MPDRESVTTHLHIIRTWASFAREHVLQFFTTKHLEDITTWADDAIELLKEQDELGTELTNAVELIHKKNERIEKLLKEQEAVEPYSMNAERTYGICPKCWKIIFRYGNVEENHYCGVCGQAVKWE